MTKNNRVRHIAVAALCVALVALSIALAAYLMVGDL